MKSVCINYITMTGKEISLCRKISLGSENFASLAKLDRDSEIAKFRYAQSISLASEISLA